MTDRSVRSTATMSCQGNKPALGNATLNLIGSSSMTRLAPSVLERSSSLEREPIATCSSN